MWVRDPVEEDYNDKEEVRWRRRLPRNHDVREGGGGWSMGRRSWWIFNLARSRSRSLSVTQISTEVGGRFTLGEERGRLRNFVEANCICESKN